MADQPRLVFDTNTIISAMLMPGTPSEALVWALDHARFVASDETLAELLDVIHRPKFDRYLVLDRRRELADRILANTDLVPIDRRITACRDPDDDKFLEVAVNGGADAIVTGDADLLALHPFEGVAIRTPADFLGQVAGDE